MCLWRVGGLRARQAKSWERDVLYKDWRGVEGAITWGLEARVHLASLDSRAGLGGDLPARRRVWDATAHAAL